MRIWQGHQIAGLTESFDGREEYIVLEKLWKYNQAMLTLVKGAKKQLVIKPTQGSWGTRDIALKYAEEADDHMITNFDTREIKQDLQTSNTNKLALIFQRVKVSEDKHIRRVISKSKEGFHTEKWLISKEEKGFRKQNSSWVLDMTQSSLEGIRKNNIDLERTSRRETNKGSYSLEHASLANIVYIDSFIEIPTRNFIKELKDTRNVAEWKMLSTHKIEQAAIETVQALISEPEKREKLQTSELQKCLFSKMYKEQKERREGYTRGLFKNTVIEELINQGLTKRKALDRSRCEKMIEWKQGKGISKQQKLGKRTKGQDKKKINGEKRKEKTKMQKNSYQKSRKPPNSKEATLQKVKDRKKITNRRIDTLVRKTI
ncbi:14482_t:CDS:2 [Dentiscutata erythropus]|uniref:14482_t:CDS:1 n=1 Tax=Dentiscutata erythropus TaxID=1348616 RepID=A0A9N9CA55_9GLOM|nr:14482_t:CDS:2 [Dentiscutata erythropus]